ncbi:CHAT domain-containing protein [Edaphobacter paludis]|uniref:CHAT domain-containing protein n=1 Tax=Edaphobacter paludis TaxID=3035702 RepID=A0AAU7D6W3_9BACT
MARIYDDFELLIQASGEHFVVQILNSPTGQATSEFDHPFTQVELSNFYSRIGQSHRSMRRLDAPDLQAAKQFGDKLFKAAFTGEVLSQLRSSINVSHGRNHGLRLRLRLKGAPALAELPWEFLYDLEQNQFLATSSMTPVVRFLDLPHTVSPMRVRLPLRVLVILAGPRNLPCLDAEGEWDRLKLSLANLEKNGVLVLERMPTATLEALRKRARGDPFHILHFVGHGGFDTNVGDGVLHFEDLKAMSHPVSGQLLGSILRDHDSLRLAVLNACEGARQSNEDPFSGVAQSLCQQGLPAIIAMQFEISDDAAKAFAEEFYGAIADGYPVDAAVSEGRKALYTGSFGQEWATPVLYMRSPNGVLFDIQRRSKSTPGKAPAPDPSTEPVHTQPVLNQPVISQPTLIPGPLPPPFVPPPPPPLPQKSPEQLAVEAAAEVQRRVDLERPRPQPPPPAPTPIRVGPTPPPHSNRKLFIGLGLGLGVVGVVIAGILIANIPKPTPQPEPERTPATEPATNRATVVTPPSATTITHSTVPDQSTTAIGRWIEQFVSASEGPSTQTLRAFYGDTVSPYFAKDSASWADIQSDKEAYFDRFPQIRYAIVGEPQHSTLDNGDHVVDYTLAYSEVRKDGKAFTGRSHYRMTLREIDGSLKIIGIEERKVQ